MPPCSPVDGVLPVLDGGRNCTVVVDPGEPVLQGHYPGSPIFPGVCLIEYAHRGALSAAPAKLRALRLVEIESARFLRPVRPGDAVLIEISGEQQDADWRCRVTLSTANRPAARIRLRYRSGDQP
ncbi:3-hydroxyacyl-ACP dehydratase FabZ family protein [Krasilnikovia sp. MM14-A1259]|uniref:3-hydroxyacyl-ACP dehydratase FabZ family protein n=1 Tax=Krasilnikovia sp. MM14-A1259 TaxID=3373539 RepID=UPI0037F90E04